MRKDEYLLHVNVFFPKTETENQIMINFRAIFTGGLDTQKLIQVRL